MEDQCHGLILMGGEEAGEAGSTYNGLAGKKQWVLGQMAWNRLAMPFAERRPRF